MFFELHTPDIIVAAKVGCQKLSPCRINGLLQWTKGSVLACVALALKFE